MTSPFWIIVNCIGTAGGLGAFAGWDIWEMLSVAVAIGNGWLLALYLIRANNKERI